MVFVAPPNTDQQLYPTYFSNSTLDRKFLKFLLTLIFSLISKNTPGSQLDLRDIEAAVYDEERKLEMIEDLRVNDEHEYLVMAVCRNPVEKLLSVYKVMQDPRVIII